MPNEASPYHDPNALTVLLSTTGARCTKVFRRAPDGSVAVDAYDFGYSWIPAALAVPTLSALHDALAALSFARSRCVIRGALVPGTDVEFGIPRRSVGPHATFQEAPRQWFALDVDGYAGGYREFLDALGAALPIFQSVDHIVQRTSSFGQRPGRLNVRLWFRCNQPATGHFWERMLWDHMEALSLDPSMYRAVHIHYTAAPIFQDGVPDPCAERVTLSMLTSGCTELDISSYAEADRLSVATHQHEADAAIVPEEGSRTQIENALARIGSQRTGGSGHFHAGGAAHELYGIGCPFTDAEPVLHQLIAQAHGRTPREGEVLELWNRAADMARQGLLRTSNPPVAQVFSTPEPPPLAAAEAAAAVIEATEAAQAAVIGEWTSDPHINAERFYRAHMTGFLHWSAVDFELTQRGYWRSLETDQTLDLRISRASRMKRAKVSDAAFALRAIYQREYLDPPCRLSTNARLDDVLLFRNGYVRKVDVLAGRPVLYPHDPDHFSTAVLGADFDPSATCPRFDRFLHEILPGDDAAQTTVLRMMAYLLLPDITFQRFFMLLGVPSSGKSTLAKLIDSIVGTENTAAITDMEDMLGNFGLQPLLGKLVIYLPEANILGAGRNARRVTNLIKQITGGDRLTVNRKNCPQLNVQLPGRVIITCNNAPELGDDSGALDRRLVVVSFQQSFRSNPEVGLESRLIAERSGVVNRLLAAMIGLYAPAPVGGFYTPDSAREERDLVLRDASPVAAFLSDCLTPTAGATIHNCELMTICSRWCAENGISPISGVTVGRSLARWTGVTRLNNNGRAFRGVALSPEGIRLRVGAL